MARTPPIADPVSQRRRHPDGCRLRPHVDDWRRRQRRRSRHWRWWFSGHHRDGFFCQRLAESLRPSGITAVFARLHSRTRTGTSPNLLGGRLSPFVSERIHRPVPYRYNPPRPIKICSSLALSSRTQSRIDIDTSWRLSHFESFEVVIAGIDGAELRTSKCAQSAVKLAVDESAVSPRSHLISRP
jgi:hypothetical protein